MWSGKAFLRRRHRTDQREGTGKPCTAPAEMFPSRETKPVGSSALRVPGGQEAAWGERWSPGGRRASARVAQGPGSKKPMKGFEKRSHKILQSRVD